MKKRTAKCRALLLCCIMLLSLPRWSKIYVSAGLDDDSSYALTTDGTNDKISSLAEAVSLIKADLPNLTTFASLHFDNFVYLDNETAFSFADFQGEEDFYLNTTGTIYISHLTPCNTLLFSHIPYSKYSQITFAPLDDFYTVKSRWNGSSILVDVAINVTFDENGGAFATEYQQLEYFEYYKTNVVYPTSNNISQNHHTFKGWAGKLTISDSEATEFGVSAGTYYFDKNMLLNYLNNNGGISTIETYFSTSIEELPSNLSGFSNYSYTEAPSTNSEKTHFEAILLFTNLKKTPTFTAVWSINSYTITVITKSTVYIPSITKEYGSTFELPESITRTGYTFAGWFEDSTYQKPLTDYTVTKNKTIYANWTINSYTLTIKPNNGEENIVVTKKYNEDVDLPSNLQKAGYTFVGWIDESTGLNITLTKMSANNLSIVAKYDLAKFYLYLDTHSNAGIISIFDYYTASLTLPTPEREGYIFTGWHVDEACATDFELTTMPSYNSTIHAGWRLAYYNLTFYVDPNDTTPYSTQYPGFNTELNLPENPEKPGFKFDGWYEDTSFVIPLNHTTMPSKDLILYAKWLPKSIIQINTSTQTYDFNDTEIQFDNFSQVSGFYVFYKIDGSWTNTAPTNAGSYDVKVVRTEDNEYAAFEAVIKNGLVIKPEVVNYGWLIVLLFAVAIIEFGISIVLRVMRKMKLNQAIVFAPQALLLANTIISSSQIALIVVASVLALAGFVLMVYQIVKLHRTIPLAYYEVHKEEDEEDEEERHKIAHDRTDKTPTFSSQDVEEMLNDSNYFARLQAKRKKDQIREQKLTELQKNSENEENGK